jgi:hypothetical protein
MAAETAELEGRCASQVHICDRLLAVFETGRITLEEYGYNFALRIANGPIECAATCVDRLPVSVSVDLFAYLDGSLTPVDFMPDPAPFIAESGSVEAFE